MFLNSRCPISTDEAIWVHSSLTRLIETFGKKSYFDSSVVLPEVESFPKHAFNFRGIPSVLLSFVCRRMLVNPDSISLRVNDDNAEGLRKMPTISFQSSGAAATVELNGSKHHPVTLQSSLLKDPIGLVAALSHEIAHVTLHEADPKLIDDENLEPLTDLTTVFFGMGIFTCHAAFRFRQSEYGYSTHAVGYLPQQVIGYAMGIGSYLKSDLGDWWQLLPANGKDSYRSTLKYLNRTPPHEVASLKQEFEKNHSA